MSATDSPFPVRIQSSIQQLDPSHRNIAQLQSAAVFYQRVLEQGKKQEVCIACARALSHDDLPAFEAYVSA